MNIRKIYSVIVLFCYIIVFSQDKAVVRKKYEISVCGKPQKIILTEYINEGFVGVIETELTKKKRLKSKKEEEIIDENYLELKIVKDLILKLQDQGIDSLIDCNKDIKCSNVGFLDGESMSFKISDEYGIKEFSYANIYPESLSFECEETELRRKVQILLTIIDEKLNLEKQFGDFTRTLKKGVYCFWKGINRFCLIKKK